MKVVLLEPSRVLVNKLLSDLFTAVTPYDKGSQRHGEITNAIVHYRAKDIVSINTVTKDGFKKLQNAW